MLKGAAVMAKATVSHIWQFDFGRRCTDHWTLLLACCCLLLTGVSTGQNI